MVKQLKDTREKQVHMLKFGMKSLRGGSQIGAFFFPSCGISVPACEVLHACAIAQRRPHHLLAKLAKADVQHPAT